MKKEIDKNRTSLKRNLLRTMFGTALLALTSMTSFGQSSDDPGGDAFWQYLRKNPNDFMVQAYYSNPQDMNVLHCIKNRIVLEKPLGLTPEQISQLQSEQTVLEAQINFISQQIAAGLSPEEAMAAWEREEINLGYNNGVTTTGNPSNSAPIDGPTMTAQ